MIRRDQDNVILRCNELCQQFMVDMYVKIESERLRYLQYNRQRLHAEDYIHLRDVIVSNADNAEIGNSIILPSSYIGSPRHIQEYIQDAWMLWLTCANTADRVYLLYNPKWLEITYLILPGRQDEM